MDITTLGRGGSDTTAVAVAAAVRAKHCYIYSDVDGIYSTDPNKVTKARKLESLSYTEMLDIANEGAKVLHNRCIEIGKKFNIPIITKSTFNNNPGSIIQEKIEGTSIKSIVKNDDIYYIILKYNKYSVESYNRIFKILAKNKILANNFKNDSRELTFTIKACMLNKFYQLMENELKEYEINYYNISRIAIVGYGIMNDDSIIERLMKIVEDNKLEMLTFEITETKIAMMFNKKLENHILETFHTEFIT